MKIAVLGTGIVGRTISEKLASIGHTVLLGTRNAASTLASTEPGPWGTASFSEWAKAHPGIEVLDFDQAAANADLIFNCTSGIGSLAALKLAGEANLAGKILLDVANPLDFSKGMPPRLSICNDDSLGESIQRAFPEAKVIKTLNTMNCFLMVDPARVPGEHEVFVAGNDAEARAQVAGWLKEWFGWKAPVDLGDITAARGLEAWLPLWLRLFGTLKTADFNIKLVRP
jgi:predicted dinucleotide-binding enzyme